MTPREVELSQQLAQCQEALTAARLENQLLRQKLDALARRIFGVSSEALDPAQLQLLLQMPELKPVENPPAPLVVEKPKPMVAVRKHRAPRLPDNLPVVEEVIDPEPVKAEPQNWRCIGQEVSEQLDYEPGRFLRRRTVRRKYVHCIQTEAAPVIAPLPERLLDRSLPAAGLLAHILVGKYCDHLPLYRQKQIYSRAGVHLPRQSLARWIELAADWLEPIYEHIRTGVMAGGYVQVDETPIAYLEPGHGQTRQGYLWTCSRPGGGVIYHWQTSRAAACLDNIIPVAFVGRFNATVMERIGLLPAAADKPSNWPAAGRTCAANFTMRWNNRPGVPAGSCGRSRTSTGSKLHCAISVPGQNSALPCALIKALPLLSGSSAP